MHQKHAKQHQHAYIHLHRFVVTNQCPWCEITFASQAVAIQHARASVKSDVCKTHLSHINYLLIQTKRICCPTAHATMQ